jgi:hypothetical protein
VATSDLQLAVRLGILLPVSRSALVTSGGMDRRIGILALLVALAVAFVAIIPDFELAPATLRLVQRVRALASFAHFPSPRPSLQAASAGGARSTISSFSIHNCIIELTCSRLC